MTLFQLDISLKSAEINALKIINKVYRKNMISLKMKINFLW